MKFTNSPADRSPGVFLAALLLAGIAFFSLLGRRDIVTSHEARVIQVARQMAESGWPWNTKRVSVPSVELATINGITTLAPSPESRMTVNPWIVPVLNNEIRLKKPPLPYWCDAILFRLFGWSEAIARFPTALLGFLGALLIYDLAKKTFGPRAAMPALLIWITTHFVVDEYRKAMADPYLAFTTLMAVWAWIRASVGGGKKGARYLFLILFYVALAIGGLAKGPIVLLTSLPGIAVWELVTWGRKPKRGGAWWIGHLIGIAIFALLLVPWILLVLRELPQAPAIWKYEIEAQEKPREAYYYFLTIWQLALLWTIPWAIGIVMAFIHGKRGLFSPRGRRRAFAVAWLVIVGGVFSLNGVKKNAYLLPIMPALVLLAADVVSMILVTARRRSREGLAVIAMIAQVVIGMGFAVSVLVLAVKNHFGASAIGACGVVLILNILPIRSIFAHRLRQWLFLQATAYVAVIAIFIGLYIASLDNARSPRAFASAALSVSKQLNVPIWRAQSPEEMSVYLPMHLPDGSLSPRVLIGVDDPKHEFVPSPVTFEKSLYGIKVTDFREIDLPVTTTKRRYRLFDLTLDRGAGKMAARGRADDVILSEAKDLDTTNRFRSRDSSLRSE